MKRILFLFLLLHGAWNMPISAHVEEGDLPIQVKFVRQEEDPGTLSIEANTFQISFTSECADCGKIFITIDGKYAGAIDVKFRNTSILVKKPGTYKWKAKSANGKTAEGVIDCK